MEKTDVRSLGREAQQQLRNQAIRLRRKGLTHAAIADIVGVNASTVRRWYKAYERTGLSEFGSRSVAANPASSVRSISTRKGRSSG